MDGLKLVFYFASKLQKNLTFGRKQNHYSSLSNKPRAPYLGQVEEIRLNHVNELLSYSLLSHNNY